MKPQKQKRADLRNRAGFSLIELAIVLGVIGLITAAIWATAAAVRKSQPISDAAQLIVQIGGNVKNVYSGHPAAVPPQTVAAQIAQDLYPRNVVNAASTNTVNPWGGTIFIQFPAAGNPVDGFSLVFTLPGTMDRTDRKQACIAMVTRFPGSATAYAGGLTAGTLPAAVIPLRFVDEGVPALNLVNRGGWVNVTGIDPTNIFPAALDDCTAFAMYFKL